MAVAGAEWGRFPSAGQRAETIASRASLTGTGQRRFILQSRRYFNMQKLKSLKIMFLTALFALAMASVAFAGPQDFTLVNNTGYPIYVVNVSPSNTNNWEEDILGSQVLGNGESLNVSFNVGNQQYWDIQAVFEDGSSLAWMGIDLLSVAQVTLNGDGTATLQ